MAGDWIKMEMELCEKPEVIMLSTLLTVDRFSIVGRLHKLWSWINKHTRDGHAQGVTKMFVDELVNLNGFSDALLKVNWLEARSGSLSIPCFDRHNGQSAKERAQSNDRKKVSRSKRDKNVTREEKRRVIPSSPNDTDEQFAVFWNEYPKKLAKDRAQAAFKKVDVSVDVLIAAVRRVRETHEWQKEEGKFIPHAATWLNGKRWEDELSVIPSENCELGFIINDYGQRMKDLSHPRWKEVAA